TSCALGFVCQLYLADEQGVSEANTVRAYAELAVARQRVQLRIRPQTVALHGLRFDISNKPGLLRLFDLALHDSKGECLWKWDGSSSLLDRGGGYEQVPSP